MVLWESLNLQIKFSRTFFHSVHNVLDSNFLSSNDEEPLAGEEE